MLGNVTPFIDLKTQYQALKTEIDERIQRVLDHGQYIMGPEVNELEEKLSTFTGAKHCITVASGTEALLISLMALGIKPGDEIITTPFTFVATAEVMVLLGAVPAFVDIDPDTWNINSKLIEGAITPKTKAIMPVSLYGQPSDMDEINLIAKQYGLHVIEDAAQSFGAEYKGKKSCNLSTIGCTSFFPSKPLGCYGDGGAIFTSDDSLARVIREIRVHGQERRYFHTRVGVGGRMDTIQCAVVLAKLSRLDWEIKRRQEVAHLYTSMLGAQSAIKLPYIKNDRTSVFAQYTIEVSDRDNIGQILAKSGIPTAVHYPVPLHLQPAYNKFHDGAGLEIAERSALRVLSLPCYADLDSSAQLRICDAFICSI